MALFASVAERDSWFRTILAPDCSYCGSNPCYSICPNSPDYYSPEREREDALFNDSLSYDMWFREAVAQYERVHGEPYVS
jgi:hypothetical protein